MMDDVITSLSSDSTMAYKGKNIRATFKIQTKMHYLSIKKKDDALFKNRQKNLPLY